MLLHLLRDVVDPSVDALVQRAIDREHRRGDLVHVAGRVGAIPGDSSLQAIAGLRDEAPGIATAHAPAGHGQATAVDAGLLLQPVQRGDEIARVLLRVALAQRRDSVVRIRELRGRTALPGEQVGRERHVALGREAARAVLRVVDQATVLVDRQDGRERSRALGASEIAEQLAALHGDAHVLRLDAGATLDGRGGSGSRPRGPGLEGNARQQAMAVVVPQGADDAALEDVATDRAALVFLDRLLDHVITHATHRRPLLHTPARPGSARPAARSGYAIRGYPIGSALHSRPQKTRNPRACAQGFLLIVRGPRRGQARIRGVGPHRAVRGHPTHP